MAQGFADFMKSGFYSPVRNSARKKKLDFEYTDVFIGEPGSIQYESITLTLSISFVELLKKITSGSMKLI